MPELGRAALAATLLLALYALIAGAAAAKTRRRRLADSAQTALLLTLATTLVATVVLLAAFARNDYSFVYVWELTSDRLPILYTLAALWGGQSGSLLFWLVLLTAYSAAAVVNSFMFDAGASPALGWWANSVSPPSRDITMTLQLAAGQPDSRSTCSRSRASSCAAASA